MTEDRRPMAEKIHPVIDLRTDGATRPSERMRDAARNAAVGDDIYGEDPTINQLERRAAEIFEREAALFVPSGTMGNQVAIFTYAQRGEEIVCEWRSDAYAWEMALPAALTGCLMRPIQAPDGLLTWDLIEPWVNCHEPFKARTGLIMIENPNNMNGGIVAPPAITNDICHSAHALGIPVHLDGARIFNAAVALKISAAELARPFDSVMFCLSKGLGAPVGSMLTGSSEFIRRARIARKMLGGGMRQCGMLAAAGLIALEEGPQRLHQDHENAQLIAQRLARISGIFVSVEKIMTNVVHFCVEDDVVIEDLLSAMARCGVLATSPEPRTLRLVTHLDVDRQACIDAVSVISDCMSRVRTGTFHQQSAGSM